MHGALGPFLSAVELYLGNALGMFGKKSKSTYQKSNIKLGWIYLAGVVNCVGLIERKPNSDPGL